MKKKIITTILAVTLIFLSSNYIALSQDLYTRSLNDDQASWISNKLKTYGYVFDNIMSERVKTFVSSLSKTEIMFWAQSLLDKRIISASDYQEVGNLLREDVVATTPTQPSNPIVSASLLINGSSRAIVIPGQKYTYTWKATNAIAVDAKWKTISGSSTKCGGAGGSLSYMKTFGGSNSNPEPIVSSFAGCSWEITYYATGADGSTKDATVTLSVPSAPSPTATLLINNQTDVVLSSGDRPIYTWTSTNGDSYSGEWSSADASKCGSGGSMPKLYSQSGTYVGDPIGSSHSGCVWTMKYKVTNSNSEKVSSATITVR